MLRDAPKMLLLIALSAACDGGAADGSTGSTGGVATGGVATGGVTTSGGAAASAGKTASGGTAGANGGAAGANGGAATAGAAVLGGASNGGAAGASGAAGKPATGGSAGAAGVSGAAGASGAGGAGGGISYTTDFDLTESPLSEKGAWHHDGLDWTVVESSNGVASNTQALGVGRSGPTQYNDSFAYLTGFPPDQQASATVHLGTIDASCTHEVEILLRWADSAHNARGYECNVAFDGSYAQIVRWNGVVRASAQDATFATGNPGIGFWRGSSGCGTIGDFGFTHYAASAATK